MSTHTVYIGSKPWLLGLAWVKAKSGKYKSYRCLLMNVDQTDCAGSISMCSSCLFCGVNWLLALQLIIIGNRRPLTVNFKHGDALLHSRVHSADAFIQSGLRIHKGFAAETETAGFVSLFQEWAPRPARGRKRSRQPWRRCSSPEPRPPSWSSSSCSTTSGDSRKL